MLAAETQETALSSSMPDHLVVEYVINFVSDTDEVTLPQLVKLDAPQAPEKQHVKRNDTVEDYSSCTLNFTYPTTPASIIDERPQEGMSIAGKPRTVSPSTLILLK